MKMLILDTRVNKQCYISMISYQFFSSKLYSSCLFGDDQCLYTNFVNGYDIYSPTINQTQSRVTVKAAPRLAICRPSHQHVI